MSKIFLSHASKDVQLVDRFFEFLQLGMGLERTEIFCSLKKGNLPTGENFIEKIREEIKECKAVIFLITEAYLESKFCLTELGAAWALGQSIYPLIVPPLTYKDIEKTPMLGNQCLNAFCRDDLFQLGTDLNQKQVCNLNLPSFYEYVDRFLSQNANIDSHTKKANNKVSLRLQKYIEKITEQAKSDDKARFLLGTMYWEGMLIEQNKIKAKELLLEAASNEYAPAQYKLSSMYYKGDAGEQSFDKAFKWEERAGSSNNPIVLDALAFLYRTGLGCTRNLDKALQCYNKAISLGCESALAVAAEIYSIQGKFDDAIAFYKKSVDSGYKYAALHLGMIYKHGMGNVEPDHNKAAFYLHIAAKEGITEAKYQLGQLFYMGYAVVRDFSEAVKWFEEAAEDGDTRSQYNLGYAYHHGIGVEYNWELATHWYEKAAKRGHQLSQIDLADLYVQTEHQEYKKALYWYSKAAEQNSCEAHRKLGDMYSFGIGCEIDQIKALEHYEMAAKQKEYLAQLRLDDYLNM